MTKRQRLGSLLVAAGTITHEQLDAALSAQRQFRGRLGTNLVELRLLNLDGLAAALSRQHGVPAAGRSDFLTMDSSLIHLLPPRAAKMYLAVPLGPSPTNPRVVQVAMMDPDNLVALDEIATILGCRVTPLVTPELRMQHLLERVYGIKPERRTFLRVVLDRPLLQRSRRPSDTPTGMPIQPAQRGFSLTPPSMVAVPMATPTRDQKARQATARDSAPATPYAPTEPPQGSLPRSPPQATSTARRPPVIEPPRADLSSRGPAPSRHGLASPQRDSRPEPGRLAQPNALPLVGGYQERSQVGDAVPDPARDARLELDPEPQLPRYPGRPKAESATAQPSQPPPSRLSLHNFMRFPRRDQRAAGLPDLTLDDLTEHDALALLDPLPEAREPTPRPPAPSDPTALTLEPESGRTRPSCGPPRSDEAMELPLLDSMLGAMQRRLDQHDSARPGIVAPEDALAWVLPELESATDRQAIGQIVAHYLGTVFSCGVVLVVKGEVASGWIGAAPGLTSMTVESIRVHLNQPSPFQTVVRTAKPYRGAAPAQPEAALQQFWKVLNAEPTREILILPVMLKARAVNLIYAQSGPTCALPIMAEADAMQVAAGMARAYQRLILARHGA